jgi:ribosomal protein L19E
VTKDLLLPAIQRYGNNEVVLANDRFTEMKRAKSRKDIANIIQ